MNTLTIQQYEEQIAVLSAKVRHLADLDRAAGTPSLYSCTRCGLLYQSLWGCGCPVVASAAADSQKEQSTPPATPEP